MANTHQRDNKIETESLPKICHLLLEKTEIVQRRPGIAYF